MARVPAPDDFEELVGAPGRHALWELTGDPRAPTRRGPKRKQVYKSIADIPVEELEKTSYWTRVLPQVRTSYGHICAYLAMRIDEATGAATIDHFEPKSKARAKAYEWSNFRLAAALVNTFKDDAEDVLDPFEIEDGWFVLDCLTFKVEVNPELDGVLQRRIRTTIDEGLRLNNPTFCERRRYCHDRYLGIQSETDDPSEPWSLSWLESECPFVASELRRQGRLRSGDL